MSRAAVVAVVVALAVAPPSGASGQDARLVERLGPGTLSGVVAQVDSAAAAALPVEPLVQKALEGAARGADARRIVEVVRALRVRLGSARDALGDRATESELVAGAAALQTGVTEEALRRLRGEGEGDPLDVPLVVLTDLVQRGVPTDAATSAVLELRGAGADADRYHALRYRVEQDILSGASPGIAVNEQARRILRALRGGGPGGRGSGM